MLRLRGIDVPASQANFVLMRGPRVPRLAELLARSGIGTRAFPNDPHLAQARRMVVPADSAVCKRVVATLESAFAEMA
jgi:histidinol-phosphate/aromatic aminotransferase/cobyric acid decarboxylase-like protein